MKILKILALITPLVMTTASFAASTLPGSSTEADLSFGYDGDTQNVKYRKCVTGTESKVGYPTSSVALYHNLTASDARNLLDIQAQGSVNMSSFSLDIGAKIANEMTDNEYSEVFTILYDIRGRSRVLLDPELEQKVASDVTAFASTNEERKARLKELCGNEFVTKVNMGAKLVVNIRFEFASESMKRLLEAQGKVTLYQLLTASGKFSDVTQTAKDSVKVSITAYQIGGIPSRLTDVLNGAARGGTTVSTGSAGGETQNDYAIIRCGFDQAGREACKQALNAVLKYASPSRDTDTSTGTVPVKITGSFADQVGDCDQATPGTSLGCASVSYETADYRGVLNAYVPDGVAAELSYNRELYANEFMKLSSDSARIERLKQMRVSPQERTQFESIRSAISANLTSLRVVSKTTATPDQFNDAWTQYFSGVVVSGCVPSVSPAKICGRENYDSTLLNHASTFYDFCNDIAFEMMSNKSASDFYKAEVNKILNSRYPEESPTCAQVQDDLERATSLSFIGIGLKSTAPFQGLSRLKSLILNQNEIADLSALSTLPALEMLSLRSNRVRSISPLTSISKLSRLDVAFNQLSDFSELTELKQIKGLKIFGNRFSDQLGQSSDATKMNALLNAIPALDPAQTTVGVQQSCERARNLALSSSKISAPDFDRYTRSNKAPIYNASNVILRWDYCESASPQLDRFEF